MTGARLTAALECANDAGGRCALWPSGDAHAFLRSKPRHGHVLRLRGRVGQRRTGSTDRDGSDPSVRGPVTGLGLGVFSHASPPPSRGRSRSRYPLREGREVIAMLRLSTLVLVGNDATAAAIAKGESPLSTGCSASGARSSEAALDPPPRQLCSTLWRRTTTGYAHLADGRLLKATEKIGYIIASAMKDSDTGAGH